MQGCSLREHSITARRCGGVIAACLGLLLLVFRTPVDRWNSQAWTRAAVDAGSVRDRDVRPYIGGVGALLLVGGVVLIVLGVTS